MTIIYDLIFLVFAIFYIPVFLFRKRKRRGLGLRLGLYPKGLAQGLKGPGENIWIHAVSVGEVMAVSSLFAGLRDRYPGSRLVITTVTETGNAIARKLASQQDIVLFLPFDISFIVGKVISYIKPALLIITETELWPNLIRGAHNNKIPILLVNGRISDKSFRGYRVIRFMLRPVLRKITLFLMQTEADRDRIVSLGADISKVKVAGNVKFDNNLSLTISEQEKRDISSGLNLKEGERLFVCGSTHPGEEEIIISSYLKLKNRYKDLRLLIAPRHIERAAEVENIVKEHGLAPVRISQLKSSTIYDIQRAAARISAAKLASAAEKVRRHTTYEIFILDAIGQLKNFYSIADVVFIGGSLVKKGGQNMIEPAAFARPILFGPHTFNFRDIVSAFLREEAAIVVKDEGALEKTVSMLLEDPAWCRRLGHNAKQLVEANKGASEKTLAAINRIFTNKVEP